MTWVFPILLRNLFSFPLADITDKLETTHAVAAKLDQNVSIDQFR